MAENETQDRWLWVIDDRLIDSLFGDDRPADQTALSLGSAQGVADTEEKSQAQETDRVEAERHDLADESLWIEEVTRAEEATQADLASRTSEEGAKAEEVARLAEIARAEEQTSAEEGAPVAEEAAKADEAARLAEITRAEEQARAEEAARVAEEAAKVEEAARLAEIARAEEQARAEEAARVAEEAAKAEEAARLAEIARAEEQARVEEAARVAEEAAKAEEAARLAEIARAEEQARAEEAARVAEEVAKAEEAARLAEIARAEEQARVEAIAQAEAEARAEQAFVATLWNNARSEFREGHYEQALNEYRGIIENLLPDPVAHFNAGVCLRKLNRQNDAKHEFLQALELNPDLAPAKVALAWCHLELGRPDQAVTLFEENLGEVNHGVAQGYAQALQQLDRYDELQPAYARLLERDSADVPALVNLVATAARKSDIGLLGDSAEVLLQADPGSRVALAGILTAKIAEEQFESALEYATEFLQAEPTSYEGWFNYGLAAQRTGHAQVAEQAYSRAMEIDSNRPEASTNLACILFERGDLADAQSLFHKQSETGPLVSQVLWNLGLVYERQRNYVDAESTFFRLLAAEPDRPDVLFHVGFARFQQNLWEAAAADFRRCLELKRSWLEAMVYLGLCNWNLGDLSAARHRFDDALTQDPLFIPALRCRTSLALAMGDLSTAPELEAQLADLGSTLPEFCYNLGVLQQEANQPEAAIQSYHRAVAQRPAFGEALLNLGNLLAMQGHKDEAVESWLSALAVRPELSSLYSGMR